MFNNFTWLDKLGHYDGSPCLASYFMAISGEVRGGSAQPIMLNILPYSVLHWMHPGECDGAGLCGLLCFLMQTWNWA